MADALRRTLYGVTSSGQVPPIADAELTAILNGLACSPARKELVRAGLSLVGRVPYFWGGRSSAGWNDEWNTPKLVTTAGSGSTGTLRPFGLDCSGFTEWVYNTAIGPGLLSGDTTAQWNGSYSITEAELLPGDLGFKDSPDAGPANHVLIYVGRDSGGNKLWVHCTSGGGGVVLDSPNYVRHYRRAVGANLETMVVPDGAIGAFTAQEVEWLAALVYYEARGMDSYCRELTAQVVINRVRSNKFPNTLEGVIKAPGQYGYGVPGGPATLVFSKAYMAHMGSPAWGNCMDAARKAAGGISVDESGRPWPPNVLFQHSFENPNANGAGLFRTFRTGAYWMHFNYG